MRKILKIALYTLSLIAITGACSDDIDIKQDYEFDVN